MKGKGKIRSSKSFQELVGYLKQAGTPANRNLLSKTKIWQGNPSVMDDDELMEVADFLRRERYKIAQKLISEGVLDPNLLDTQEQENRPAKG